MMTAVTEFREMNPESGDSVRKPEMKKYGISNEFTQPG